MNIILVSVYLVSVTSGLISISPFTAIMAAISKWVTFFFANFVFTVLDEVRVIIGDNAFIGPNVSLYTPCHPTTPKERNTGVQWAKPIKIGNSVWIGGSVTILPGVTIGDNCTIGAGSVVTKDIPANSIAVGNPCRVVKKIDVTD